MNSDLINVVSYHFTIIILLYIIMLPRKYNYAHTCASLNYAIKVSVILSVMCTVLVLLFLLLLICYRGDYTIVIECSHQNH